MDESSYNEMMDHGLRSTNRDNTQFDDLQVKCPIAADNPEVLKSRILSHYNNLCANSNTCDQVNPSNPVFPGVGRHFGMDSTASMHQEILINSQLHKSHACESGRKNSTIPFWNSHIRNIQDDIAAEMSLTNNFQTFTNSQVSHSGERNVQTNQGLLLNSELGYRSDGFNMANGSINRLDNNGMQMGNTIHDIHWEKKLLNHEIIAENIQSHIGSRHEISGQFLSSNSETDVINYDSVSKNSPKNRMKFVNSQFALINNAIPNIVQDNQESQIFGNLGGNRLDCARAQSVPQQSCYLYKIPPLESIPSIQSYPCSRNNKDALDGAHSIRQTGHFNAMESIGSNVASNISISQKYNASSDVFDYRLPKNDSLLSINPNFFAPGPSDSHEKNYTSKDCESQFQFRSPSQLLSVTQRNYRKTLYCVICKNELDKHVIGYKLKRPYKCCACKLRTNSKQHLLKHNIKHLPKHLCNICAEVIRDIDSHGVEQPCIVCGENFHCQTLLETHLLIHDDHFSENCRVCMQLIDEHIIKVGGKMLYKCCQCSSYFAYLSEILRHLHIHTGLRLFKCIECGDRFTHDCGLFKHLKNHWKCQTCGRILSSRDSLDVHRLEEHKQTSENNLVR